MSHLTNVMLDQVEQYQTLADRMEIEKLKAAKIARDKVETLKVMRELSAKNKDVWDF